MNYNELQISSKISISSNICSAFNMFQCVSTATGRQAGLSHPERPPKRHRIVPPQHTATSTDIASHKISCCPCFSALHQIAVCNSYSWNIPKMRTNDLKRQHRWHRSFIDSVLLILVMENHWYLVMMIFIVTHHPFLIHQSSIANP